DRLESSPAVRPRCSRHASQPTSMRRAPLPTQPPLSKIQKNLTREPPSPSPRLGTRNSKLPSRVLQTFNVFAPRANSFQKPLPPSLRGFVASSLGLRAPARAVPSCYTSSIPSRPAQIPGRHSPDPLSLGPFVPLSLWLRPTAALC